ncbi:hypothetical protein GCM10010170_008370 [Dactylosporangium salmoneum]|uniref:Uncharacterized protein n=1 Tax=Dactylosporangium salmoneum TaxID=53361 RepID=A0ABP5SG49_9ACTN
MPGKLVLTTANRIGKGGPARVGVARVTAGGRPGPASLPLPGFACGPITIGRAPRGAYA